MKWSYPLSYTGSIARLEQVLSVNIEPVILFWNFKRPHGAQLDVWRKKQLRRYIERFPHHKPKAVIKWIKSQSPNPWPGCTAKDISRMAISIRKS